MPIYLDHCATTPLDPVVLDAMLPFFREAFGNPGTPHPAVGGVVQRAIRQAREQTAELINCLPNEVVWTSGATEANNLAILGSAEDVPNNKRHIVTQVTEHSAVLEPCRYLESKGWSVTYLPVDSEGLVDTDQLVDAITPATSLVSIMWGNNEIGTLQPIQMIAEICEKQGVAFHCDAVQAAGKVVIDLQSVPISILSLSAHKFYGPKGIGALFVRNLAKRFHIKPRVFGGGQEAGLRAGTHNVPGIVGMGAACTIALKNQSQWSSHTQKLRDKFEALLRGTLADISVNGSTTRRLPHVSNISFHGTDNEGLLTMIPDIVASTGAACHVADFTPSHVLTAINKSRDSVASSLRFGFGKDNTDEDIQLAVKLLVSSVQSLRTEV
ncbi:MAG: cysteine desulfurase [Planctomycetota bacterium]|nr:MAG: cysteine desulfurase [Planctomycetota bacterium]